MCPTASLTLRLWGDGSSGDRPRRTVALNGRNVGRMVAVATENMGEHAVRNLRSAAVEIFRRAKVEGWNDHEIQKHLQEAWDERAGNQDTHRFVDSRGRSWSNAAYLQMLTRTTLARIDRNAQVNTLVGNGCDLARISEDGGGDVCEACARWEGKVISLTGATKGFPTLADAEADGLFHPNCVHRVEYLDEDEIEDALKQSGQADAAHKAAQEEAAEDAEAAKRAEEEKSDFPEALTMDSIEAATINKHIGGTTGARLVEIDGVKYICKMDGKVSAEHVRNEADADQAYRRAGIRVPDCKIYDVNGRIVKLSQYIEGGQTLGEWMQKASAAQKDAIRAELAQGYALDALFANWDVLGTAQDNVLVDKDGHAWRIDNGSAFGFRAQGAKKAPDQWEKREWPDEWRTLRTSGINKGVFDGLTAHDISHAYNQLDVDAVIRGLPAETQKALAKPLEEMKQLGARCADFDASGFVPTATSQVLETTYDLSKEGFREEVPKKIDLGNYGFCRASGLAGRQNPGGLPDYAQVIKTAAISVNKHAGFGNSTADYLPNMGSVNAALAFKTELEKYAKTDKNAKVLLGYVKEIEAAQTAGWHIGSPISTVKILTVTPPGVQSAAPKHYRSLTDHLYDRASKDGVDVGRIASYFKSQGSDSWTRDACKLKILNLAMRGKNWNPPPYDADVHYFGRASKIEPDMQRAIDFYKKNPSELEADMKGLCAWKSATQLLLENASFPGNHPEGRFMYHARTDAERFFGSSKVDGKVQSAYPIGACESGCPIQSRQAMSGAYVGIRQVPYSRINSIFFMDGRPSGGDMYLGDGERECGADLTGLPVYAAGNYGSNYKIGPNEKTLDSAFAAFRSAMR